MVPQKVQRVLTDLHEDVLVELDSVMQAEQAKRKIADEIFAGDKQRMLDIERAELRRIIRDALV